MGRASADEILDYWFGEHARPLWFEPSADFDRELRARFGETLEAAARGELDAWAESPGGALALIILLDQITRNVHRGTPRAFENDRRAQALADAALARGFDLELALDRRLFVYLPFEHAEDAALQRRSVALFERLLEDHRGGGAEAEAAAEEQLRYARRHCEIIERFGRFPHRNAILERTSTTAEHTFLDEPMSSF
jgi:uncharacterized protein (DUF924 family)